MGNRHPLVVDVVKAQTNKLKHTCPADTSYVPYVQRAKKICECAPIQADAKVMVVNTGAEALDNAIKTAWIATGRSGVVCFDDSFHGRAFMTLAMTGKVWTVKTISVQSLRVQFLAARCAKRTCRNDRLRSERVSGRSPEVPRGLLRGSSLNRYIPKGSNTLQAT